jgi:hypothetical protein
MGNTSAAPKTSSSVAKKKIANSAKTGVLSLSSHKLKTTPALPGNLRTLDLSQNGLGGGTKGDPNLASFLASGSSILK